MKLFGTDKGFSKPKNDKNNAIVIKNNYIYDGGKRVSGQLKDGDWLVLVESKHLEDTSWIHTCGEFIRTKKVSRPIWDRDYICLICNDKLTWDAWQTLPLCPNCGNLRTKPPIDWQYTFMPFCPHCETEPISVEEIPILAKG